MNWIIKQIHKETWSPYAAGILLGIVGILAVVLSNTLLGASGAFENIAGLIGKAIAPQAFNNTYFKFVMPPGITWGVILLVGVFFGGMIGAASSGTLKWGKKDAVNYDFPMEAYLWSSGMETLGSGLYRSDYLGICRRHRRWLYQRVGDLGRDVVGSSRVPVHCRDVCIRHRHSIGYLSQPLLDMVGQTPSTLVGLASTT